ncbi:MAG: hypothetical protein D6797_04950 [Bdellovibrio sp.]|nr:MAG: hypothetical protein D6797_04950 [Bdellovibrio sp.]
MTFRKVILLGGFLLSGLPGFATPAPKEGLYENGVVTEAIGTAQKLQGKSCAVSIQYEDNNKSTMNVRLVAGAQSFSERHLTPKLGGRNLYAPKWYADTTQNDYTTVVYVHPTLPHILTSVTVFKTDLSELGYEYSLTCTIQEIDWDRVEDNFKKGYHYP